LFDVPVDMGHPGPKLSAHSQAEGS